MKHPFKQVDVFTSVPFMGNPVAVVFDADILTTEQMQRIANWTNLSETTFFQSSKKGDYLLRIFTPQNELPFAGHPTIGSAHAAIQAGIIPNGKTTFIQECKAGLVKLSFDQGITYAKVPVVETVDTEINIAEYCDAMGDASFENPLVINSGPLWGVARLKYCQSLQNLMIDTDKAIQLSRKLGITGMTCYCIVPNEGVHVRSFAPLIGIKEDPVCGSGNAAVALHIKTTGNIDLVGDCYTAFQGREMGRNGIIRVKYEDDDIIIGGNAVTIVDGSVTL